MSHNKTDAPGSPKKVLENLVEKSDEVISKKIGSPVRKPAVPRTEHAGPARSRMTENEEDKLLLESELSEHPEFTRLTVQPPNIKFGTMREYQLAGLNWLIQLYHRNLSGILADEMGLGKTLQSISLLAYLQQFHNINGPHLVIVPLSTLGNWIREFTRWCPSLKLLKYHGTKDERVELHERLKEHEWHVVVTSYEIVIREKSKLAKFDWNVIVVDEAHRLKNEKSLLSQIVRILKSKFRLLLTGTPLQNNLHELWALLNFLLPETFGDSEEFDAQFSNNGAEGDIQQDAIAKLHKILRPVMLRRLKSDVEKSLKPKIETLLFVGMSKLQKQVYLDVQSNNMDALHGQMKERRKLLNIVMQLRKAANHPYLFEGVEDRSLDPYGEHLITNSGKMVVLDKLLPKLKSQDSRVLIFSQMTRQLDILEDYCLMRSFKYCRIDGTTSQDEREERMEDFNRPDSDKFLFLLSTRAGGLGINLATADIVVIFDSDWNPQMDLQAQDRAHRIGQKKQVRVYRFVTDSTIEEKIIHRAEIKLRLDALVVQQGRLPNKSRNLTQSDMLEMIRYGADKIFRSKDSSITDEDIDLILEQGQKRTAELTEKLKKHVGLKDFNLKLDGAEDADVSLLTDENSNGLNDLAFVNKMAQAMPKRERKKNYNENEYYRKALTLPKAFKTIIEKPMKMPRMEDFQFYDKARLEQLFAKEQKFWDQHQNNPDPPALSGLTDAEKAERETLLNKAFPEWRKRDFYNFRSACADFGRNNLEKICQNVQGQSPEMVKRYHKVFWQKYQTIKDWKTQIVKFIEKGEAKLIKREEKQQQLTAHVDSYGSVHEAREQLPITYRAGEKRGYTLENDRFLLCKMREVGYGSWDQLRTAIRRDPQLQFDYFLKSRSPLDLQRRVDFLIRIASSKHSAVQPKKRKSSSTSKKPSRPKSKSKGKSPSRPKKAKKPKK